MDGKMVDALNLIDWQWVDRIRSTRLRQSFCVAGIERARVFMDDKPKEEKPAPKRKVEIDLRDLFANKDVKGGAGNHKPEPPADPESESAQN